MRLFIKSIILLLVIGCSKTVQKDIFELARHGNIIEIEKLINETPALLQKKNKSGFTPLILASYNKNEQAVTFLIKKGANINESSNMGTALMAASYKSNNKISKILIDHGASINLSDKNGTTALHYACFKQNTELVRLLINNKANIHNKDNKGKTPLDYAIENNNIKILELLQSKSN